MATMEEIHLAMQTIQNLEGLRKDMRREAAAYKTQVVNGDIAKIADVADRTANEFLRRLGWQKRLDDDAALRTKIIAGLTALGINLTEVRAAYQEMKSASDALLSASKTTEAEIVTAADALLNSVVNHETVWK